MGLEDIAAEAETLEPETAPVEAPEAAEEAENTAEARARITGWRPKDEWKGDAAKWKDAETYLAEAQESLPLLKNENKRLAEANRDAQRKIARFEKVIKQVEGLQEREYRRAMTDLQKAHDEAVENGDVPASRTVLKEMDALREDVAATADGKDALGTAGKPDQEQINREFEEWRAANDWFDTDANKRLYADNLPREMGMAEDWPDGRQAYLDEIARRVERKFAARKPSAVNGGGNRPAPGGNARGYGDLPADAKQIAQDFDRMGIIKKDEYARDYWAQQEGS